MLLYVNTVIIALSRKMKKKQVVNTRTSNGRFGLAGEEPLSKTIGIRLPVSLKERLESYMKSSGSTKSKLITEWIEAGLESAEQ